jgi:hypothetical protein
MPPEHDRQHKRFKTSGTTGVKREAEAQYNELLKVQEHACAMCRKPFGDEPPQLYHDHSCCPRRQGTKRPKMCGKCVRGLLCFRCNTALGYIERYGGRADVYLAGVPERVSRMLAA